jgi:L-malate glycosyltransferase
MRIGITCYPSVGGSGIVATALGQELASRGHEVHFISYERPFRLQFDVPRLHFHPVIINDYDLFKYPDYTLPLSVKMAEVSRDHQLDVMHVHYAVPHATAAILARSMLPPTQQPRVVTTLHGTDTLLLGLDPGYGPAIHHALTHSDAVTAVSNFLAAETRQVLGFTGPIDVIHNFFQRPIPQRARDELRRELGIKNEVLLLHSSNLRPLKRIDLLLESAALIQPRQSFKLVVLAGSSFAPFAEQVRRLGLEERVIVREKVTNVEDYLHAADLGVFTSDMESFCLSILEAMSFACPSVARRVGGIPEVIQNDATGVLVDSAEPKDIAAALQRLITEPDRRLRLGTAAEQRAREHFSAAVIVPRYEKLYARICNSRAKLPPL